MNRTDKVTKLRRRLKRLLYANRWVDEFLLMLASAQGFLGIDYPRPTWTRPSDPMNEDQGKAISFLLSICVSGRTYHRQFPREFAAVQPAPVEYLGEIESNAHRLVWILSQRVLRMTCEAIRPGVTGPEAPDFNDVLPRFCEDDYMNAIWLPVSRAIQLRYDGCQSTLGTEEIAPASDYHPRIRACPEPRRATTALPRRNEREYARTPRNYFRAPFRRSLTSLTSSS